MKKFLQQLYKLFFHRDKNKNKKAPLTIFLFFIAALVLRFAAPSIGAAIGTSTGTIVGKAIGSFRVGEAIKAGIKGGKDAGLSAEDTMADVKTNLVEMRQLQVLTAGVKITDFHTLGEDYAALYVLKGSAIFTIDLKPVTVDYDDVNSSMVINIPKPQMEVYIDVSETEKLAEYQKHKFTGSAEDGAKAYLNTIEQSEEKIRESISNYDSLMEQAETAAQKQIEAFVHAVRGSALSVTVSFM